MSRQPTMTLVPLVTPQPSDSGGETTTPRSHQIPRQELVRVPEPHGPLSESGGSLNPRLRVRRVARVVLEVSVLVS